MFANLALRAGREAPWFESTRISRVIRMAVATLAILYMINGAAAAAGYVNALRTGHDKSAESMAEVMWVGLTWPIVLHDMASADPFQRIEPVSERGT